MGGPGRRWKAARRPTPCPAETSMWGSVLNPEESVARGRAARASVPRSSHAEWQAAPGRPDPVAILEAPGGRARPAGPDPVAPHPDAGISRSRSTAGRRRSWRRTWPVRRRRGSRCSAAATRTWPTSVASNRPSARWCSTSTTSTRPCRGRGSGTSSGSPPASWSWHVTVGSTRRSPSAPSPLAVKRYREAMREFAAMRNLDVWYARLDVAGIVQRWGGEMSKRGSTFERNVARARSKNSLKAFSKLTEVVDGSVRIRSDPPLVERFSALLPPDEAASSESIARRGSPGTAAASTPHGATCSTGTGSSTWPARWSVSAASARAAGSPCSSAATATTHCSCR